MKTNKSDFEKAGLRIVLCMLMACVILMGCSKDNNDDDVSTNSDYLRAKVEGKQIEFKILKAYQDNEQSITVKGGTGNIEKGEENTHIQLAILSNKNIESGVYKLETTPTMVVTYGIAKPKSDGTIEQDNYSASTNSANPGDAFEIHITSFSKTHVTGNFAGTVVQGQKKLVISEGSFSLPISKK